MMTRCFTFAATCLAVVLALSASLPSHAAGGGGEKKKSTPKNILTAEFELVGDAAKYSLSRPDSEEGDAPKASKAKDGEEKTAKQEADEAAGSLDVPMVAIPVRTASNRLTYYFVQMRIHGRQGVDIWKARARAAVVQDAIIRTSHRRENLATEDDINGECTVFCETIRAAADEVMAGDFFERTEIISKAEQIRR